MPRRAGVHTVGSSCGCLQRREVQSLCGNSTFVKSSCVAAGGNDDHGDRRILICDFGIPSIPGLNHCQVLRVVEGTGLAHSRGSCSTSLVRLQLWPRKPESAVRWKPQSNKIHIYPEQRAPASLIIFVHEALIWANTTMIASMALFRDLCSVCMYSTGKSYCRRRRGLFRMLVPSLVHPLESPAWYLINSFLCGTKS